MCYHYSRSVIMEAYMIRTQIQLTEQQSKTLKHLASQKHISIAELIREGINYYLHLGSMTSLAERCRRALTLAGKFHSKKKDLSEKHDSYLAEDFS